VSVPVRDEPSDDIGQNEVRQHLSIVVLKMLLKDRHQFAMPVDQRTNHRDPVGIHVAPEWIADSSLAIPQR
jgi:hypothetical protein